MMAQRSLLKSTVPFFMQSVQAHRKPRWLPVAKSKIYRIPKRPVISDKERIELLRVNNNYKTQMRAIRRFYHEDMIREKSTLESASSEMSQRLEAEEWERCVLINNKWNTQVANEREGRRKLELAAMEERTLTLIQEKDKDLQKRIEKASKEIKIIKDLSATFVTPENLDEAIDHALANPVDYNFAITVQGDVHQGRDTEIITQQNEKKMVNVKA